MGFGHIRHVCFHLSGCESEPCQSIQKLDFRNKTIDLGAESSDLNPFPQGNFNGPASGAPVLQMKNGSAKTWDTPDGRLGVAESAHPDWRATIHSDRYIHPLSSAGIRLLVVEDDHETGSGSWTYILGYTCAKSEVVQVFRLTGQALRLVDADNQGIRASLFVRESDSSTSPGKLKTLKFEWDPANVRYRRVE